MFVGIHLATSYIKCKEDHRSNDATFAVAKRTPTKKFSALVRDSILDLCDTSPGL